MIELEAPEIREAKAGIIAIEGLFFAVNSAMFSPKFMDGLRIGLEYIGRQHQKLLDQIGPEEVAKLRTEVNKPAPPTTPQVQEPGFVN